VTYINPRQKTLRHLDRIMGWQRGETPAPVTVEWDLSNRCYLGCRDCHFAHTHVRGPWASTVRLLPMAYDGTGDLADTELVLRTIADFKAFGVQGIVWSGGGEPTLHPDWRFILRAAKDAGLQQGMYTAGGLLDLDDAYLLGTLADWVVVSLDACDRQSYYDEKKVDRFQDASNAIRWMSDAKAATIGVSYLLHHENFHRAAAMLTHARELGATYTTFRPTIQTAADQPSVVTGDREWIDVAAPILQWLEQQPDVEVDRPRFEAYRDWQGHGYTQCHGIRLNTTITPDGRVWICPQRRGVTAIGDLRSESFAAVWARHPRQFAVDAGCRVACRLHPVNLTLSALETPQTHEAFL
jgi:cyclic pyranopterin phosphate synthase